MLYTTRASAAIGLFTLLAGACYAQSDQPKFYHLDFAVQELDGGKVTNSRHYLTIISTTDTSNSVIRTGSKVPMQTGGGPDNGVFTYVDVGVNIDCRSAKEIQGRLALNVAADISSAATTSRQPIIRQNKWGSNVVVRLGRPTVIFSSDDVTNKSQMRLELTATPIEAP